MQSKSPDNLSCRILWLQLSLIIHNSQLFPLKVLKKIITFESSNLQTTSLKVCQGSSGYPTNFCKLMHETALQKYMSGRLKEPITSVRLNWIISYGSCQVNIDQIYSLLLDSIGIFLMSYAWWRLIRLILMCTCFKADYYTISHSSSRVAQKGGDLKCYSKISILTHYWLRPFDLSHWWTKMQNKHATICLCAFLFVRFTRMLFKMISSLVKFMSLFYTFTALRLVYILWIDFFLLLCIKLYQIICNFILFSISGTVSVNDQWLPI